MEVNAPLAIWSTNILQSQWAEAPDLKITILSSRNSTVHKFSLLIFVELSMATFRYSPIGLRGQFHALVTSTPRKQPLRSKTS